MDTIQHLKDEYTYEYNVTKKFFNLFPAGKDDYAPHEKSMKLLRLVTHIAESFGWPAFILHTDGLDFTDPYERDTIENREDLLASLEKNYLASMESLDKATEKDLEPSWSLKNQGQVIVSWSKYGAMRHGLNQITHHRAQLGVYYRLLDIKVHASYGPSADEQNF